MPQVNVTNRAFRYFLGICFLLLLAVASISVINPEERNNAANDRKLQEKSKKIIASIETFYKLKGRTPWADDIGSKSPSPGLAWTLISESEIGFCASGSCKTHGEVNESTATISGTVPVSESEQIYVGKGAGPGDPIHICFLPQSQEFRDKTGALSRISIEAKELPEGKLESCPDRVSWEDIDVCYLCISDK